ncbi:Mor transcription activator family protein [Pandoraea nosoerga]|uniref:DNA-binding protein n=1 Tax=Pandoraea nosoerga TaxID=2508296 RepID=A0A5E4V0U5_9BURK|nr:Mor transcription activator family protein [Pandoraea nosoerga]VVE05741.1 DNA-binding protein [Pandoraea nosoerga]
MAEGAFHDSRLKGDFKSKGPELLVDLAEQCVLVLLESAGLDADKATQVGREIADRMAAHWGGQNIYFPMGLSYKLSQRDRQIYDDFNGANHSELARKYGVSLQWIYKIVKTVRQEEMARRQGDMFAE